MTLEGLISALKSAAHPSRELDVQIEIFLKNCDPTSFYRAEEDCLAWYEQHPEVPGGASELILQELPHYTSSIDEAQRLIPEGMQTSVLLNLPPDYNDDDCQPNAAIVWHDAREPGNFVYHQHPAIALCTAALKARAKSNV